MKPCHICEKIVRVEKAVACASCKKGFCHYCISKYFPERAATLLKRDSESLPALKISECFACIKECKCHKCKSVENVVLQPNGQQSQPSQGMVLSLVGEEEVAEMGLFRGRKVSELPLHLQRIYLKKKVLYSKHEISCLSNDKNILEQQNNQQPEEKLNPVAEEKERKEDESLLNNQQQEVAKEEAADKNEKNDNDEEQEQPDDYESEFPSRRAAHLHNQNDNSAINDADVQDQVEAQAQDPNAENPPQRDESMADQKAQNAEERKQEMEEELPQGQSDEQSLEQAGSE